MAMRDARMEQLFEGQYSGQILIRVLLKAIAKLAIHDRKDSYPTYPYAMNKFFGS
jgi:hypothetical protein